MSLDVSAGKFLLDLHRESRRMPHAGFRARAYEELRQCIGFDSGFWMRGAMVNDQLSVHDYHLEGQPGSLMEEYLARELWRDDLMKVGIMAAPGKAFRESAAGPWPHRWHDFLRRHGQQRLMSIILTDVAPQLFAVFSLYRTDLRQPFSDDDAALFEVLTPHINDAWCENWLRERLKPTARPSVFSSAVLAKDATLTLAQHDFAEKLQIEWPQWRGPFLPPVLKSALDESAPLWRSERITVYVQPWADGTTLLRIRTHHAFDGLPARQREAAERFAGGASQTEVAHQMQLASSTVNNYLLEIYRTLGIASKVELARLLEHLQS